ncbi:cytochrome P450 [Mucidula mucida]|nr:cytochrome P450 [Mucidula mucida]
MDPFLLLLLVVLATFVFYGARRRHRPPLPPGPRGRPLIGNLFDRPTRDVWLTYADWAFKYDSNLLSITVLGQPVIILNSIKAVVELFEERSTNYSDRPSFYMLRQLMEWKWAIGFMRYSDEWRSHRKIFHQYFNSNEVAAYHPIELSASVTLLKHMLSQPDGFFRHVRHHAGSIILYLVYGYHVSPHDDEYVKIADNSLRSAGWAMFPGNYAIDYLPILRYLPAWVPFTASQREVEIASNDALILLNVPYESTTKAMSEGRAETSFITKSLERLHALETVTPEQKNNAQIVKNCAAVAFAGGADTTVSAVLTTILAMILNPAVQQKAHDELDSVVGRTRLPNFEDRPNLPFVTAIFLESMRWRPVTPLAIAHASRNDDVYNGYFIPGGSTVLANVWAIMHDEDNYPNAEAFDPQRFLGSKPQPDPTVMGAFGYSRRICPGRHLAVDTAYIAIVSLLWAFMMTPAQDPDGRDIVPDVAYADGLILQPLPFNCKIVPRFPELERVVNIADVGLREGSM